MDIQRINTYTTILEQIPEIRYAGDPVLRTPTTDVSLEEGIHIATQLEEILLKYRAITGYGRGLAAPQIGIPRSIFITFIDNQIEVFINPKITERSSTTNKYRELCMSAGIFAADVERPEWIVMEWTDDTGRIRHEKIEGFKARLYQHEEAHLRGRLNLDDALPGGIQCIDFDPLKEQLRKE